MVITSDIPDDPGVYYCRTCKKMHAIDEKHCDGCGKLHTRHSSYCYECDEPEYYPEDYWNEEDPNVADVYGEGT